MMTCMNRSLVCALALTLLCLGCADDTKDPDFNRDAETDSSTVQDATQEDGGDAGSEETGVETDAGPIVVDSWDRRGACTIDTISGPVIVFMESSDPEACVQVVFEKSEDPSDFELTVDSGWRTSAVVVEGSLCSPGTLVELENGTPATRATGNADLRLEGLGIPEALESASFELTFPDDQNSPFDAFIGVLDISESIVLQQCDP